MMHRVATILYMFGIMLLVIAQFHLAQSILRWLGWW